METIIVCTTTDTRKNAQALARLLIKKELVSCVNIIGPITSVYRWEKKIIQNTEYKLIIKSANHVFSEVKNIILKNHAYTVPEISKMNIEHANKDYLNWVKSNIKK